jgi:hypothetical protein
MDDAGGIADDGDDRRKVEHDVAPGERDPKAVRLQDVDLAELDVQPLQCRTPTNIRGAHGRSSSYELAHEVAAHEAARPRHSDLHPYLPSPAVAPRAVLEDDVSPGIDDYGVMFLDEHYAGR